MDVGKLRRGLRNAALQLSKEQGGPEVEFTFKEPGAPFSISYGMYEADAYDRRTYRACFERLAELLAVELESTRGRAN